MNIIAFFAASIVGYTAVFYVITKLVLLPIMERGRRARKIQDTGGKDA